MKLLSIVFVALLIWSQTTIGDELTEKPLSMFRDGEFRIVGYALFALLLAIGVFMATELRRKNRAAEAGMFLICAMLLALVMVTPTFNGWHEAGAALLLLLLFGYYAGRLILAENHWLYFHLAMPLALLPLVGAGYGPWQKGLVVYLLILINFHWQQLQSQAPSSPRRMRCAPTQKKRVIYVVELGKSWHRRRQLGSTSCVP